MEAVMWHGSLRMVSELGSQCCRQLRCVLGWRALLLCPVACVCEQRGAGQHRV